MQWQFPYYFYLVVPILMLAVLLYYFTFKRYKEIRNLWKANSSFETIVSHTYWHIGLLFMSLLLGVFALANLRKGDQKIETDFEGAEIIVAMDVSRSMLANDLSPNRLSIAKNLMAGLIEQLPVHKVGLVVFAGNAYPIMPLTEDKTALATFLKGIQTNIAGTQGTDVAQAIELCLHEFTSQSPEGKTLIIISDGEDHEARGIEAARAAEAEGLQIVTVGIGTENGSYIPIRRNGRTFNLKDQNGKEVISRLNASSLRKIASVAGGSYITYTDMRNTIEEIRTFIEKYAEKTKSKADFLTYRYYFQYFIMVMLALVVLAKIFRNI